MTTKLLDLGWCIARLRLDEDSSSTTLTIISPDCGDGGCYAPPHVVVIRGNESLKRLHDLLNEAGLK